MKYHQNCINTYFSFGVCPFAIIFGLIPLKYWAKRKEEREKKKQSALRIDLRISSVGKRKNFHDVKNVAKINRKQRLWSCWMNVTKAVFKCDQCSSYPWCCFLYFPTNPESSLLDFFPFWYRNQSNELMNRYFGLVSINDKASIDGKHRLFRRCIVAESRCLHPALWFQPPANLTVKLLLQCLSLWIVFSYIWWCFSHLCIEYLLKFVCVCGLHS